MNKKDRERMRLLGATVAVLMISVMTTAPNEFKEQHAVNESVVSRVSEYNGAEISHG